MRSERILAVPPWYKVQRGLEFTLDKQTTKLSDLDFADIHCHMMAGIDDGARTLQEMTRMAEQASGEGIGIVCFTPHTGVYGEDSDPEHIKDTFAQASLHLKKHFPHMRFFLGNEIYYSCDIPKKLENGTYLPINGSRYVLVEFSPGTDIFNIKSGVRFITMAGYKPILAHVERYKDLYNDCEAVRGLREMGAVIQVNSRYVMKRDVFGKSKCKALLRENLVDVIATDCHDTKKRPPQMRQCYECISANFGKEYADTIMKINPRLILANKEISRPHF